MKPYIWSETISEKTTHCRRQNKKKYTQKNSHLNANRLISSLLCSFAYILLGIWRWVGGWICVCCFFCIDFFLNKGLNVNLMKSYRCETCIGVKRFKKKRKMFFFAIHMILTKHCVTYEISKKFFYFEAKLSSLNYLYEDATAEISECYKRMKLLESLRGHPLISSSFLT